MSSIGEMLRVERLRRGLSLEQISERTKISLKHLEAIEAEDFASLPGSFFARSFIRQYMKALELDESDFGTELEELGVTAAPAPPEPVKREYAVAPLADEGRGSGFGERFSFSPVIGFVLVVLACSGAYTLWQRARQSAPESTPAAAVQQPKAPAPAPVVQPVAQIPVPEPAAKPAVAEQPPALPAKPAAADAKAEAGGSVPAEAPVPPDAKVHLKLAAIEDAWVRITSDQKVVFQGTLKAGQTRAFYGVDAVSLRTGNAGAVQVNLNGKSVGPLGPKGQIRDVQFTPEGHKVVEKPKPVTPADVF